MKTAVIYSGQTRTFGETFPNQYDKVLRQLPNPEFFVSVAADEQAPAMSRLYERFPRSSVHIEHVKQPTLPEPPPGPKWLQMYPPSATPQAILRQLWALHRAWEFFWDAATAPAGFDLIVRLRPDLAFTRLELPHTSWVDLGSWHPYRCVTPWWARWGGVNDRVAFLGIEAAKHYFTTFSKVERLMAAGCPLHPETIIDRSLRDGLITPEHTLATEFVAVRLDGSTVAASITEIDFVDYARSK